MEVVRITPRGYCHGVVDAFRIAKQVRESTGEPVHMLGQLVHNTHVTEELQLDGERVAVTCQTTLSVWDTEELIDAVRRRYPHAEVHNEICLATQERQEAAVAAARGVDAVVVVGSPRSSNSNRLVEVVQK